MKKVLLFLSFVLSSLLGFAQDAPELVCPTPFVAALPLDATSAGVIWNSTAAATYTLQYRACRDTAWKSVDNLTAGTNPRDTGYYVLRNLVSCQCYVVRLRANCSATEVSDWRSFEFKTAGCVEPCRAPTLLFAAPRDSMASLNWSPSTMGRTYIVQWKSRTDSDWHTETAPNNYLIVNRLQPCNEYQFRVKAVCSTTDTSDFSEPVKFKTSGCVAPCSTPRELRAVVAPDRSSAYLTWASTGARAYEVTYTAGDSAARTVTVTTNVLKLVNVASCKTYKFSVRSICGSATSTTPIFSEWSTPISVNTEGCPRCESPRRLSYAVTELGAVLKWDSTVSNNSFTIQWIGPRDSAWHTVANIAGNQYTLTGLTACTGYSYRVKTNCSATSSSNWSAPVRFQTKGCAPVCVAPKNLKVFVNDTVAVISWIGLSTTSSYKMIVTSSDGTFTRELSVTGNTYTLAGLPRCKAFKIQLKTVCSNTSVSDIAVMAFETRGCPTPCGAPREVAFQADSNKVTLKWDNVTASKYYIEYRLAVDSLPWRRDSTTTNAFILNNLQSCKTYVFRVASVCTNGVSTFTAPFAVTTLGCPAPCQRPTGLSSEIVNDTVASLKFIMTPNVSYIVQYRIAGTANWISYSSPYALPISILPIRIAGLQKCQRYEWRVIGTCATGFIAESEILIFETKGCPTPCTAVPRDLVVTPYSADSAKLIWIMPTAGLTYEVRYGAATDSSIFTATPIRLTANGLILRGLAPCRYYIAQVRTICPNGQASEWVTTIRFRVGANCMSIEPSDVQVNAKQFISDFGVYPNPGSESVQVVYTLQNDANIKIELMNLQGQIVNRLDGGNQEAGNYVQTLDNLSGLNTGIYLLVIKANGKVVNTQKWQKE